MLIKLLYSPYNLLLWAISKQVLPPDSVIICAKIIPEKKEIQEDKQVKIVIDEEAGIDRQITQTLISIASYIAIETKVDIKTTTTKLMEGFTEEWMLHDFSVVNQKYEQIMQINEQNILHPVTMGLAALSRMGIIGGDPLVYIGEDSQNIGDFVIKGKNTQEQIRSFFSVITNTFGESNAKKIEKTLADEWEKQRAKMGDIYGFIFQGYDFASELSSYNSSNNLQNS